MEIRYFAECKECCYQKTTSYEYKIPDVCPKCGGEINVEEEEIEGNHE